MKKRFLVLFMTAVIVFAMCGCGGSSDTSGQDEQAADTTQEEQSSDASQMSFAELAEHYAFELEGKDYSLPCPVSDFLDNGWYIEKEQLDSKLDPNNTLLVFVYPEEGSDMWAFYMDVGNFSDEAKALSECIVSGITIESQRSCSSLTLKKAGLKVDLSSTETAKKSADQLLSAYGKNEDVYYEQEGDSFWLYSWTFSRQVPSGSSGTWGESTQFQCAKDKDGYSSLRLYYLGPKE